MQFHYLFSPLKIGPVVVRNRIFTPPYETNLVEDEARGWWDRLAHFHAERAKGGVGLIIMSEVCGHQSGAIYTMTTLEERHIPHLRKIPEMVHAHGAKIFQLIHNPGPQARPHWSHHASWGPSPRRGPGAVDLPHVMDQDDIRTMVGCYARTASIIKEAGYDGIEIQGSHGFLVASFLSPASNHRSDAYGGTLPNRMRFLEEILAAVREAIGRELALGVSISVDELNPQGLQVAETTEIAARLEEGDCIDYLTARIGDAAAMPIWIGDMQIPPGAATHLAAELKRVVQLPVMTVLRIKDPMHAESILADGQADMIGMGRATLCDPELANKAQEGRLEDIRYCISCNQGCLGRLQLGLNVECVLNPAAGLERQYGMGRISKSPQRKKVLVIGGGPAGLKAAEMAAIRGNQVTLLERREELGGQILLAGRLPGREEVAEVTTHLVGQVRKLGIEVCLHTDASAETVAELSPEVVIVATGSTPLPPAVPGMEHVPVSTPYQILSGEVDIDGEHVVVFDGGEGHWKFCGTAELLAQQGKRVTLVTPRFFAGFDIPPTAVPLLYRRLAEHEARVLPSTTVTQITEEGVVVLDVYSKAQQILKEVDALVWVGDNRVCDDLYQALKGQALELYAIGDCVAPRKIDAAIREGFWAALQI
jgi:mycofactocin system FadH/OYE family oxidoreductase 2